MSDIPVPTPDDVLGIGERHNYWIMLCSAFKKSGIEMDRTNIHEYSTEELVVVAKNIPIEYLNEIVESHLMVSPWSNICTRELMERMVLNAAPA